VGDFVELESGVRGHVREIAMRYTRVSSNGYWTYWCPIQKFISRVNWTLDDSTAHAHSLWRGLWHAKRTGAKAGLAAALKVPGVVHNNDMETAVWLVAMATAR
jgi:hypothetical protein